MSTTHGPDWTEALARIESTVAPSEWVMEIGVLVARWGLPADTVQFKWMRRMLQSTGPDDPYQAALARERALVVRLLDKDTELAACRMALQQSERLVAVLRVEMARADPEGTVQP
jgi:hypothetical protein